MATARAERRLAAIMAADVVGYSALMERDEDRTLARLKAHRRELIDPLVAEHRGRTVKLLGDGALVEFASVVDAVRCAVLVQQGMAERERDLPEDERLRLRIGINLGDVVHEADGDLYGDGVNVAARLEQLAEPGGVIVSGTAYDHLKGKLDLAVEARGRRQLKNIAEPVRVYGVRADTTAASWRPRRRPGWRRWRPAAAGILVAVLAAVGIWSFWPRQPGLLIQPSVAVLPFANLGGDEATGRLADGITEDIITDLSRFRELDVIAQNSTAVYKGKPTDVREIGRALSVRYVLEGSIQRQGDQLRVTAQLIDATTGTHFWSERWDRPAGDFFAVQTEIAEQTASRIGGGGAIPEAESRAARRSRPTNLSAYELYLMGQHETDRQTDESIANAVGLLERAVSEDPNLARAWVVLAFAYSSAESRGIKPAPKTGAALAAAQRAVELDPMDADAHAALADILGNKGDFARAKAELEIALRLNPGDAETLTHYAGWASALGQPELGAEAADRALRLNPNAMNWAYGLFSYAYFMAGRFEDAVKAMERRPLDSMGQASLGLRVAIYAAAGQIDAAHRATSDALARHPDLTIEGLVSDPSWSDLERDKLVPAMRRAGFPACATAGALAELPKPYRLPECGSAQRKG